MGNIALSTLNKGLVGHWPLSKNKTSTGTVNLILDGSFDTACGVNWVCSSGWAIAASSASKTAGGATSLYEPSRPIIQGNNYKFTIEVTAWTAGDLSAFAGTGSVPVSFGISGTGIYSAVVTAVTSTNTACGVVSDAAFAGSIDNVTVYDATGNVLDVTGSGNSGARNGTTWTTGVTGSSDEALLFNGTSNYVDLSSHVANFSGLTQGSISVWVKPDGTTDDVIFTLSDGDTGAVNEVYLVNNSQKWSFVINTATPLVTQIIADNTFTVGGWYNVVVTQDGVTSKMYVNGVLQADTDGAEWFNDLSGLSHAHIGALTRSSSATSFWDGDIADVRVYNRALTPTEISALYTLNGTRPSITVPSSMRQLSGRWEMDKSKTRTGTVNKVSNGTFDSDTSWIKGTGWTISGGTANCDGSQTLTSTIFQPSLVSDGITYKIVFDVLNYTTGTITAAISGGATSGTARSANGTYTEVLTQSGASQALFFRAGVDFVGSIDNIRLYDTTGQVSDSTGNGNHGERYGTTWTTDRFGVADSALSFNGTSDYVDLSSSNFISDFGSDTAGSFSGWFKTTVDGSKIFSISEGTGTNNYLVIDLNTGKIRVVVRTTSTVIILQSDVTVNDNVWHHFALTQDGTTSKMYVDGVLQTTTDSGEWFTDLSGLAYMRIGGFYSNGVSTYFYGSISDLRYYSGRALTPTEVLQEYRGYGEVKYAP